MNKMKAKETEPGKETEAKRKVKKEKREERQERREIGENKMKDKGNGDPEKVMEVKIRVKIQGEKGRETRKERNRRGHIGESGKDGKRT